MKGWCPNPGLTVITRIWSTSDRISSSTTAGVAGLMATPARFPSALMRCTVRCKLLFPSQWTRKESEPASTNSSRKRSGSEIIRCISNGRRVTRRSEATIGAPIQRLGKKCPSITSTWMRSAPACSASITCSPKRAKSAARRGKFHRTFVHIPSSSWLQLSDRSREVRPTIRLFSDTSIIACLDSGRFKDTLNGSIQQGVELGIRLPGRQLFYQGPRKARHDAVIPAQAFVGFFARIATRQRNHPQDIGMSDAIGVEVVLLGQRKLEHHKLARWQLVELLENGRFEQLLCLGLFRAVNVNFRLDDRHETSGDDLPS